MNFACSEARITVTKKGTIMVVVTIPPHLKPRMNPSQRAPTPVSRELVRLIRETSKLDAPQATLSEHMRAVDAKQAQAIEFYIRACVLRLEQAM